MSAGPLRIDVAFEGLDLLADAYANAPTLVQAAAEEAGRAALPVLRNATEPVTPVRTGYLLSTEDFSLQGPFNIVAEAGADYAAYVHARVPFFDLGAAAAEGDIDAIYDQAMTDLAEGFAGGE